MLDRTRRVAFNEVDLSGKEVSYLIASLESGRLSGDGHFTHKCHALLESLFGVPSLLMHSCTAALEAAAMLSDIGAGDEVIMPSYTFVSTANAVVLRGAVPVFVDIRPDTLNLDERLIEDAITPRTRAIFPVHYAGVGCEMDVLMEIAQRHSLKVVEDAAQGFGSTYKGKALGTIGDFGCISFHETKNIVSGEGGALFVNKPEHMRRALYVREKGTNRTEFLRQEVSKYEWLDIGSSFLPSDLIAAVLAAQLERSGVILAARMAVWSRYFASLQPLHTSGRMRLPVVPAETTANGHIFYLLAPSAEARTKMLKDLKEDGIQATSHYVPLHNAPAGKRFARAHGELAVTVEAASTIIRLPCYSGMKPDDVDYVIERVLHHASRIC